MRDRINNILKAETEKAIAKHRTASDGERDMTDAIKSMVKERDRINDLIRNHSEELREYRSQKESSGKLIHELWAEQDSYGTYCKSMSGAEVVDSKKDDDRDAIVNSIVEEVLEEVVSEMTESTDDETDPLIEGCEPFEEDIIDALESYR